MPPSLTNTPCGLKSALLRSRDDHGKHIPVPSPGGFSMGCYANSLVRRVRARSLQDSLSPPRCLQILFVPFVPLRGKFSFACRDRRDALFYSEF